MLIAAFGESIKSGGAIDIENYIHKYAKEQYGFTDEQAASFWTALKTAPYEISGGKVYAPLPTTVKLLLDSTLAAAVILNDLRPDKNKEEFEQYKLMEAIRVYYLQFHYILETVNSPSFTPAQVPGVLAELKTMMANGDVLDRQFIKLNKAYLYPAELKEENDLRNMRIRLLYDRLSKTK